MQANLLRAEMAKKGVTQIELAKILNISEQTMTSRMNGRSAFDIFEAKKICEVLEISADELKCDIFFR